MCIQYMIVLQRKLEERNPSHIPAKQNLKCEKSKMGKKEGELHFVTICWLNELEASHEHVGPILQNS